METIVKQTRAVGTSAGVLLPRSWLDKKVVVTLEEKTLDIIARDVIEVLIKKNFLDEIKGMYLVGSYARGDYDVGSDIDVLVITKSVNKVIDYYDYEITLVSEKKFLKNLASNLYSLVSVREAKPIINKEMIENFQKVSPKLNLKKMIKEIESIVKINVEVFEILKETNQNVPDSTLYSLVLRLREIYFIRSILKKHIPKKKDFLKFVKKDIYDAYLRVKGNKKELNSTSLKDGVRMLELLKKWLKELKE